MARVRDITLLAIVVRLLTQIRRTDYKLELHTVATSWRTSIFLSECKNLLLRTRTCGTRSKWITKKELCLETAAKTTINNLTKKSVIQYVQDEHKKISVIIKHRKVVGACLFQNFNKNINHFGGLNTLLSTISVSRHYFHNGTLLVTQLSSQQCLELQSSDSNE